MAYEAFVLTPSARNAVLQRVTPAHQDVICHHITHRFSSSATLEGGTYVWEAFARSTDGFADAILVRCTSHPVQRPDNRQYHVTISVDRGNGGKPVMSNGAIAKGSVAIAPFTFTTNYELIG